MLAGGQVLFRINYVIGVVHWLWSSRTQWLEPLDLYFLKPRCFDS